MKEILRNFRWSYLPLFALPYLLTYAAYAMKLIVLFRKEASVGLGRMYHLVNATTYMSFIVPASGELFRVWFLKSKHGVPPVRGAVLFLFERLYSLVVLVLLMAAVLGVYKLDTAYDSYVDYGVIGALVVSSALVLILLFKRTVVRLIYFVFGRISFLRAVRSYLKSIGIEGAENLFAVSDVVFDLKALARITVFIILQYLFVGMRHLAIFGAVGFDVDPLLCIAGYNLVTFIMNLPLTPGRVGAFEAVYLSVFNLIMRVPLDVAVLVLIADRLLTMAMMFLMGLFSFNRLGIKWKDVSGIKKVIFRQV